MRKKEEEEIEEAREIENVQDEGANFGMRTRFRVERHKKDAGNVAGCTAARANEKSNGSSQSNAPKTKKGIHLSKRIWNLLALAYN